MPVSAKRGRSKAPKAGLSLGQRALKRSFDIAFSGAVVVGLGPLMALAVVAATADTGQWGVFSQVRIGREGRPFRVYKVRTMKPSRTVTTTVTTGHDPRITPLGRFLRRSKIDELPQFVNVLLGQMSVVGPRPDVPGYADCLEGTDRLVLAVRPGVTGPASVFFRDEEALLSQQADPERYNTQVLWPAKVRINAGYVRDYRFCEDLRLVMDTAVSRWALSRATKARLGQLEGQEFPAPYAASRDA